MMSPRNRLDFSAAEDAIRRRFGFYPGAARTRISSSNWRLLAFRNRISRAREAGTLDQALSDIAFYANDSDASALQALREFAESTQKVGIDLRSDINKIITSHSRRKKGPSKYDNVLSDHEIALAVSDAALYGNLKVTRNRAAKDKPNSLHSACSLVAKILGELDPPIGLSENAIEKIWERVGRALPTAIDELTGWRD
jgi:hypothetical protein